MTSTLLSSLDSDALKIGLVLLLALLLGLERKEPAPADSYRLKDVRASALLGLLGYGMAALNPNQPIAIALGLIAIAGLLLLTYWQRVSRVPERDVSTDISTDISTGIFEVMASLATYLIGALVYGGLYWIASAIVVVSLLSLGLKSTLEGLTQPFKERDILTLGQFLLLLLLLPVLPNQPYGPFQLNPFKVWLVVVAVSTLSYLSFLLQQKVKGSNGVLLIAVLGGVYSSTVTTIALAKQSTRDFRPQAYAGGILMASGVMYIRLAVLVYVFNAPLGKPLLLPFGLLAIAALGSGLLWAKQEKNIVEDAAALAPEETPKNPLELKAAFLFALLFVGILILTHYVVQYGGQGGVYGLAAILGVTDVDPFILSMTQSAGSSTPIQTAAIAILIAAASNNVVKGLYAIGFGDRLMGRQSLGLLVGLALMGLVPCWFLAG